LPFYYFLSPSPNSEGQSQTIVLKHIKAGIFKFYHQRLEIFETVTIDFLLCVQET
jgi:hypothetical protein